MKEWHFEEKVYKRWLTLVICPADEFVDAMRKVHYDDVENLHPGGGLNMRLNYENSDVAAVYIWLPRMGQATLAHELLHYVLHTFYKNGVPIHYDNEEVLAYYLEYWMREINRVYRKFPDGRTVAEARKGG